MSRLLIALFCLIVALFFLIALPLRAQMSTSYTCTDSKGNVLTSTYTPAPVVAPPPSTNIAWGYHNGVYSWAGDYSYSAAIDYADTTGGSPAGKDIAVKVIGQWGAWQPYMAANWSYSTAGYTKLTFSLKPTIANQTWQIYFMGVGDVFLGPNGTSCAKPLSNYVASPAAGQWATYTIPLTDLCVKAGASVYKFAIQDQTGRSSNLFFVDNVGFGQ